MASASGTTVDVPSKARTFWVKKEGDPRFVKLRSTAEDVDDLIRDTAKELGITDRLSTLILYVATDKAGKAVGPPLDSTDSVEEALPQAGKIRIVIKATGAATAPGAAATAGAHSRCAVQSSVRGGRL
jgi:hypothetical protein